MARTFGITGTAPTAVVLNTLTVNKKPEIAEARDEDGKVTDRKAYSLTETVSVEGLVDGTGFPEGGQTASIGGKTFMCEDSTVTEKNVDYQRYAATLTKKDSETQVAYAS